MWLYLSLAAGLFQSARNGLARSLSGAISPILNSWARFAFNLPLSTGLVGLLVALHGLPAASFDYFALCLATALTQLLGNVALIAAFRHANFAQVIILHKLEILFTAVIGVLLFAELPTPLGWLGILVTVSGALLMHVGRRAGRGQMLHVGRGSLLALAAGLCLVFASFFLKEASAELARMNPRVGAGRFEVAAHTLFHVTWMEVLALTLWLRFHRTGELGRVPRHWRRMALIGATGFLGSLGWFWAYSLTLVAYVKAVGQIETVAAVVYSIAIWKEREVFQQLPGMALVVGGILLVLAGATGP